MNEKNPWHTLVTKVVYENHWIRVREDEVIRPDGKPGIYSVVETRVATGVVALSDQMEVYLVGQFRYATNQYSWEIIEGGTEENETPLVAAQRELREEGGLVAKEWLQLGNEFHLSNCISSERAIVYIAKGLKEVEASPDGTEVLQIKKIPFKECVAMVVSGDIKDAVTIVGVLRAEKLLEMRDEL